MPNTEPVPASTYVIVGLVALLACYTHETNRHAYNHRLELQAHARCAAELDLLRNHTELKIDQCIACMFELPICIANTTARSNQILSRVPLDVDNATHAYRALERRHAKLANMLAEAQRRAFDLQSELLVATAQAANLRAHLSRTRLATVRSNPSGDETCTTVCTYP